MIAVGLGALLYLGLSIWAGLPQVTEALASFAWRWTLPILGLSLFNYALRFLKWHYLLGRLGVRIGWLENAQIFIAGLAMPISPGKAGELL